MSVTRQTGQTDCFYAVIASRKQQRAVHTSVALEQILTSAGSAVTGRNRALFAADRTVKRRYRTSRQTSCVIQNKIQNGIAAGAFVEGLACKTGRIAWSADTIERILTVRTRIKA